MNGSLRDNMSELSTYDNHPADIGTETFEREKDIALNENATHHLEDVLVALDALRHGTYGSCSVCRQPIPFERLQAVPTTLYCIKHVPNRYSSDDRPVEEEVLAPPFGRTSLDELPEQNQFDGEDAWQIVERYGSSNSPAMQEGRDIDDYDEMYIEADENDGYVELYESFIATDMYGQNVSVVRNEAYRKYMSGREGQGLLEPDDLYEEENDDHLYS